jgi:hypothetical protein
MIIQSYPDELDYVNAQLHPSIRDADDKSFLGTFCLACLRADAQNYEILRLALNTLILKYPANPERLRMERHDRRVYESPITSHESRITGSK